MATEYSEALEYNWTEHLCLIEGEMKIHPTTSPHISSPSLSAYHLREKWQRSFLEKRQRSKQLWTSRQPRCLPRCRAELLSHLNGPGHRTWDTGLDAIHCIYTTTKRENTMHKTVVASKKRTEKERNEMKWNVKILSFCGFGSICSKTGNTWYGWGILGSIILLWDESMFSQGYVKYILHFSCKIFGLELFRSVRISRKNSEMWSVSLVMPADRPPAMRALWKCPGHLGLEHKLSVAFWLGKWLVLIRVYAHLK